MSEAKAPNSRVNLDKAIERAFGRGEASLQARTLLADVVVAQMLPGGVVKGGNSLKIRYGDKTTRFTRDLDTARIENLDDFLNDLERNLEIGWSGFTGRIVERRPANPEGVPKGYVMRPFDIKLSYNGKPWATVRLEIGHNEIGDADDADMAISDDVARMFETIGLPTPAPIALMKVHHQIAQKLHGLTEPESKRAHDLIDLQIIAREEQIDFPLVKRTCERLFAYRNMQQWPPAIVANVGWQELYAAQNPPDGTFRDLEDAIEWGNGFIKSIEES